MVMDPTLPRISVRDLLMQAFLTGWELSDKAVSQDEYLQSSIQVIEVLQVEPESLYAEEGLGLPDGEEVDHLDDWLRADGKWLYYGVEEENFFLIFPSSGRTLPAQKTSAIPTRCSCAPDHVHFTGLPVDAKGNFAECSFLKQNANSFMRSWRNMTITPRCSGCGSISSMAR